MKIVEVLIKIQWHFSVSVSQSTSARPDAR